MEAVSQGAQALKQLKVSTNNQLNAKSGIKSTISDEMTNIEPKTNLQTASDGDKKVPLSKKLVLKWEDYVWRSFLSMLEELEKQSKSHSNYKSSIPDRDENFSQMVVEAFLFASLCFPGKGSKGELKKALIMLNFLLPHHRVLFNLFEATLLCHHLDQSPVIVYCQVYEQAKVSNLTSKDFLTCGCFSVEGLQALALTSLHLYLTDRSPLTYNQMTFNESSSVSSSNELGNPAYRMELLQSLYKFISPCFLKAQVAFALALYMMDIEDFQTAEKLAFESLFVLDTLMKDHVGLPPLLSLLGGEVLVTYAEILKINCKYKYAVMVYDVALSVFELRGNTTMCTNLLSTVGKLASMESDWKHAIVYYVDLLDIYLKGVVSKTNEVNYISEIISNLYVELGNFAEADDVLSVAMTKAFPNYGPMVGGNLLSNNYEPTYLKMQILRTSVLLKSFWFDKGLDLLEAIMRNVDKLSQDDATTVLEMLATAYLRKGMFQECNHVLNDLSNKLVGDRQYLFWRLAARNCYHSFWFRSALFCVDQAIIAADTEWFSALGKLYYFRGKVLQNILRDSSSLVFPTTLSPEKPTDISRDYPDYLTKPVPNIKPTIFRNVGDILQEGKATFEQAMSYAESTGDDVRLGKALCMLAELMTEYCFPRIAFYKFRFVDISHFPSFNVSAIASNTREADKAKKTKAERTRKKQQQKKKKKKKKKKVLCVDTTASKRRAKKSLDYVELSSSSSQGPV
eukprot:TRINITY_DN4373_c0_g2_i19.p1 TRINITY_DN4373_c0_g2~~TRINITY_DN4373_c0_g2_i19.p1  ORF type:complete len:739 (-),score=131.50 TRINITY_DN4373_c0_g2_i19:151-2367(-)